MEEQKIKPVYKVISLFIKVVILISSLYYIWDKLRNSPFSAKDFSGLISAEDAIYFIPVFLLMFVNWGLEAFKWKILVAPVELITFRDSLKGVFAGITVSLFTPNRIGEFAGRVFFLQTNDKFAASVLSVIGSFLQLLVTILAGIIAYIILQTTYYDYFQTEQFISTNNLIGILVFFAFTLIIFYIFLGRNPDRFPRLKRYLQMLQWHSSKNLQLAFSVSVLRYLVFSVQYYLTLKLFGISGGITIVFALIALTFFVISAIPTFALTEITVRSGAAVFFFSTISNDHASIIASSLFLWIINLALPSLIGSPFVWQMKFFKS